MRIHGVCSYNGANYSGWQKQINETSVQKEIEKVEIEMQLLGLGLKNSL